MIGRKNAAIMAKVKIMIRERRSVHQNLPSVHSSALDEAVTVAVTVASTAEAEAEAMMVGSVGLGLWAVVEKPSRIVEVTVLTGIVEGCSGHRAEAGNAELSSS